MLAPLKKSYDKPRQRIKKQRHHSANRSLYSQSYGFSSSHVWDSDVWELDHKEGWTLKNWCFQIVVLEKTLESPSDSREIKPVNLKGNQPWLLIERTEAEAPILSPRDAKSQLIRKDPDAGKIEGRRKRGQQRMRWHHQLNGQEFEQTQGGNEGQEAWSGAVHRVAKSWTWLSNNIGGKDKWCWHADFCKEIEAYLKLHPDFC